MRKRSLIDAALAACAVLIFAWLLAGTRIASSRAAEDGQQPKRAPAAAEEDGKQDNKEHEAAKVADIFGTTKLWTIHLELTAAEYEAMQPPAPAYAKQPAPTDTQPVSTEPAPAPAGAHPKSAATQPPPAANQPESAAPKSVSTEPAPADIVVQPRGGEAQTYDAASFMPPIQRADGTRESADVPQPR